MLIFFYVSLLTQVQKLMNFILKNAMIDRRLENDIRIFLFYSNRMLHDEVIYEVEKLKVQK